MNAKYKKLRLIDNAIFWMWEALAIGLLIGLILSLFNSKLGELIITIFGSCLIIWLVLGGWILAGYFFEKLRYKVLCQNKACSKCKDCEHYVTIWVQESIPGRGYRWKWAQESGCKYLFEYHGTDLEKQLVRRE